MRITINCGKDESTFKLGIKINNIELYKIIQCNNYIIIIMKNGCNPLIYIQHDLLEIYWEKLTII